MSGYMFFVCRGALRSLSLSLTLSLRGETSYALYALTRRDDIEVLAHRLSQAPREHQEHKRAL